MRTIVILAVALLLVTGHACTTKTENQENMGSDKAELDAIFPKGEKGSSDLFTGNAYPTTLVGTDSVYNTLVGNVYFEPGARSNWHSHPAGQILIITDGIGYHQINALISCIFFYLKK